MTNMSDFLAPMFGPIAQFDPSIQLGLRRGQPTPDFIDATQFFWDLLTALEANNPPYSGETPALMNYFGLQPRSSGGGGTLDYGIKHDHDFFFPVADLAKSQRRAVAAIRNCFRRPIMYHFAPLRQGTPYETCGRPVGWVPPLKDPLIFPQPGTWVEMKNGNRMYSDAFAWCGYDAEHLPIGIFFSMLKFGKTGYRADFDVNTSPTTTIKASFLGGLCCQMAFHQAMGIVRNSYLPDGLGSGNYGIDTFKIWGNTRFYAKLCRMAARLIEAGPNTYFPLDMASFLDFLQNVMLPYVEKGMGFHVGYLPLGNPSYTPPIPAGSAYFQLNELSEVVSYLGELAIQLATPFPALYNRIAAVVMRNAQIMLECIPTDGKVPYFIAFPDGYPASIETQAAIDTMAGTTFTQHWNTLSGGPAYDEWRHWVYNAVCIGEVFPGVSSTLKARAATIRAAIEAHYTTFHNDSEWWYGINEKFHDVQFMVGADGNYASFLTGLSWS